MFESLLTLAVVCTYTYLRAFILVDSANENRVKIHSGTTVRREANPASASRDQTVDKLEPDSALSRKPLF